MSKKYYWLKLKKDFFTQPKIKKLRRIAGGDTYTVIYLKMMLLSLENNGVLEFEGVEETFSEEIALTIDEDPDNVSVTINYLFAQNLIEEIGSNNFLMVQAVDMTGNETDSAIRMRRLRENRKEVVGKLEKTSRCDNDVTASDTLVISCDTDKEKKKEKDIEKDSEKDTESRAKKDYQQIADMYNDTCVSFPHLTKLSDRRRKAIKARFKAGYTLDDFQRLFELAESSEFLKGGNGRNWSATFDWLIQDGNMAKVLDGNYQSREPIQKGEKDSEESENSYSVKLW